MDPYFCSDPEYSIDLMQYPYADNSAAKTIRPFSRSLLCDWIAGHVTCYRIVGGMAERGVEAVASLTTVTTVLVASINMAGLL